MRPEEPSVPARVASLRRRKRTFAGQSSRGSPHVFAESVAPPKTCRTAALGMLSSATPAIIAIISTSLYCSRNSLASAAKELIGIIHAYLT
jgi:hypothetical protein